jgi:pseudaminic acid synthase
MKIKINKKITISPNNPPIIVAEISGNHGGKKSLFLKHIKIAAKYGADMIKIQSYEPEDITINKKNNNFRIKQGIWKGKYLWNLYEEAHTPFSWHREAFKLAKKLGIILFSTPFSNRAVDFLEKLKVPIYKISSFEITDVKLVDCIAKTKKPVIISTGMASIKEIQVAIKIIRKYHSKIIILYCVSGYPTPEDQANIINLKNFKNKFKNSIIGISDHTNDINSSLAATALGASVIEKHFKISRKLKSPDSKFSITPEQLKQLKNQSLKIFKSLGKKIFNGKKNIEKNSLKLRRSIYATKDIKKNEKLSKYNISTYRPKIGLDAKYYFNILGKKTNKNIYKFSPIYIKNLK